MPLPVYSTRFVAGAATESPAPYTVPAGYIAVVRDIDVSSGGGAVINWECSINGVARFAGGQFTIEALNQFLTWRGRVVLNAGETVVLAADGSIDCVVGGYLLLDN